MLGASWAHRRAAALRLARNAQSWRSSTRRIALSVPRGPLAEAIEHPASPATKAYTRRKPYSTQLASAARAATALLEQRSVEEATSLLARFTDDEEHIALVKEIVDNILASGSASRDPKTFISWLEAFPDATSASSNAFHLVFTRLVHHIPDNVPLIESFGVLCASKGYQDFLATHVEPFVTEHASKQELESWKKRVRLAGDLWKGLQEEKGEVLEEAGGEYEVVASSITTTLQMVEATLPRILPALDLNDALIFEDKTQEYSVFTPLAKPVDSTAGRLEKLIQEDQLDEAYVLLRDVQTLGSSVPASSVYEIPAMRSLQSLLSATTAEEAAEHETRYLTFLRLLAPVHALEPVSSNYSALRKVLMETPLPPPLLMTTALTLASKGFAKNIGKSVISTLYSDPNSTLGASFIYELEDRNRKYWETYEPERAGDWTRKVMLICRASAIRCLSAVGRLDTAVELLPDDTADIRHPSLQPSVKLLLKKIHATPKAREEYEWRVLQALGEAAGPTEGSCGSKAVLEKEHIQWLNNPEFNNRKLTRTLASALRTSHTLRISALLAGEMVYYNLHRRSGAVARAFLDHFQYVEGVGLPPREAVETCLKTTDRSRYHDMGQIKNLIKQKITPGSEHVTSLWIALAYAAQDMDSLRILYQDLLHATKSPVGPRVSAFLPFLRRFMREYGPEEGERILEDMKSVGMAPTISHYAEYARSLAWHGQYDSLLNVLGWLEGNMTKADASDAGSSVLPDGFLYTSLMRTLLTLNRVEEAEEMRRRIRSLDLEPKDWKGKLILRELDEELHNLKKGIRSKRQLKRGMLVDEPEEWRGSVEDARV